MSNIGLTLDKPQIDAILKHYGVSNVSVFGSFARHEATTTVTLIFWSHISVAPTYLTL